jgi:hypothetical protein
VSGSGANNYSAAAPGASNYWELGGVIVRHNNNYASAGSIEVGAEASIQIEINAGEFLDFIGTNYVGGTLTLAHVSFSAMTTTDWN